ncbi:MAG: Arc family DNA-binding protein [Bauldia sp.]|nr:Arc family DNA-binding protein [Bauldia sp.]MCW5718213.1 Arc family DNA-binding protein [Bauldia sp.]
MVERKAFPLRIAKDVFDAMQRWADDDIRSVNAQIEFVLREALNRRGRLKSKSDEETDNGA